MQNKKHDHQNISCEGLEIKNQKNSSQNKQQNKEYKSKNTGKLEENSEKPTFTQKDKNLGDSREKEILKDKIEEMSPIKGRNHLSPTQAQIE